MILCIGFARLATFWTQQRQLITLWCVGLLLLSPIVAHSQYSYPPAKYHVADIFFVDSLYGWVLAPESGHTTLFSTADGGNNWLPIRDQKTIYRISFLDARLGWALIVEQPGRDLCRTVLYATKDGGHTWSRRSTVIPARKGHADLIAGFLFLDPQHGWFVGRDGLVLETTDGGRSIHEVRGISNEDNLYHIYAQADKLWMFGNETILASFDRGHTWESQLDDEHKPKDLRNRNIALRSGFVLSSGHGWAAGAGSAIVATNDFGNTWRVVFERKDHWFTDISFSDDSHGCAVGASNLLDCTTDGGKTWTSRAILPSIELHKYDFYKRILFTSADRCWALEEGGFLFRSDNGGSTWQEAVLIGGDIGTSSQQPAKTRLSGGKSPGATRAAAKQYLSPR
jgi:photosystem II stability/assembly factor-like uncharacterized protein